MRSKQYSEKCIAATTMQEEKNVCALCNNVANQRCCECKAEYYCSKEHQKSHWKIHSKNCRAYKLVENSQIGRHYVATRNIKVGETVIYDKKPLVTTPDYHKVIKKENDNFSISLATPPVCLGCYVELTADNAKLCDKCGWSLCRACTKHGTECEFTIKHRKSRVVSISETEYGQPHPAYEIIGVIRALALRYNNPKAYRKLLNLQDHSSRIAKNIDLWNSIGKAARFVKTFFEIEDVEDAEICKIIGIIAVNGYKINISEHAYAAVYHHSSYIEHNCRANCSKSFTSEEGVFFWAAVPISKGDHIATSYVNPCWGTKKRREHLYTTKFFDCTCERCKDPTEFGTMCNAIKCTKEQCDGYALPLTFLVNRENYADFVCRKCKKTIPRKLIDRLERNINIERASLQTDNISQYREFIEKWRKYLHENNSYIFEVETELACANGYEIFDLRGRSKEYVTDIMKLCTKLTERLQILAPAEHRLRAVLLYLKVQATLTSSQIQSCSIDEKFVFAKKLQKDLNEVQQLLHREPGSLRLESSVLISVCEQLQQLKHTENRLLLDACFQPRGSIFFGF